MRVEEADSFLAGMPDDEEDYRRPRHEALLEVGTSSSGNHGHAGRPGKRGGSAARDTEFDADVLKVGELVPDSVIKKFFKSKVIENVEAFHGTSHENAEAIRKIGFKPSVKGAGGPGVYFSTAKTGAAEYGDDVIPVRLSGRFAEFKDTTKIFDLWAKVRDVAKSVGVEPDPNDGLGPRGFVQLNNTLILAAVTAHGYDGLAWGDETDPRGLIFSDSRGSKTVKFAEAQGVGATNYIVALHRVADVVRLASSSELTEGGSGSGDFGHAGNPGHVGGSVKGVDELRGKGDDLDRYFTNDPSAVHLPISQVYSTKDETADPKFKAGQRDPRERAAEAMLASYNGEGDKRKPINVEKMEDGRYHITDGNATYQVASMAGWTHIRAHVSERTKEVGTASSGDYGHAGRKGMVGGSSPSKYDPSEHDPQLVAEARAAIAKAQPREEKLLAQLRSIFGDDAISGRVKTENSIVEKVETEGDRRPEQLWDVIGARVTVNDYNDAENAANYIREQLNPTREKNMNVDPKPDGYHAIHFNVDVDGQSAEIQVRTPNQTKWSDWAHEQIYKPHADEPERAAAIEANRPAIDEYARQAASYYESIDAGRRDDARMPPCTEVIKITVGCLE